MTRFLRSFICLFVVRSLLLSACSPAVPPKPIAEMQTQVAQESLTMTSGSAPVQIHSAGAAFPLFIYSEWMYAYSFVEATVEIDYQGMGSGAGKKAILAGAVDFAGSDSLLNVEEYQAGKDLQMYPVLAGAVVIVYNFKPVQDYPADFEAPMLVLDRQTLVEIYDGTVNKWNDPGIIALNPQLADYLPDAGITVVHRSDASGTTELFTKSLASFSSNWTIGSATTIDWPVDKVGNGLGAKGNQGVTEAESLAAAMNDFGIVAFNDKLTATIVDGDGNGSWPISGFTYLILHTTSMTDCVKARKLLDYIHWSLTDSSAGNRAAKFGYSVLPGTIRNRVLAELTEVTCNGQPVMK